MKRAIYPALTAIFLSLCQMAPCWAKDPDCTGVDRWPAVVTQTELRDAAILYGDEIDNRSTRVIRISSEKIGPNRYRQVHLISFKRKDGSKLEAFAVNDVSSYECSVSGVDVYVIGSSSK